MSYNFKVSNYNVSNQLFIFKLLGMGGGEDTYKFKYIPYSEFPAILMLDYVLAKRENTYNTNIFDYFNETLTRETDIYGSNEILLLSEDLVVRNAFPIKLGVGRKESRIGEIVESKLQGNLQRHNVGDILSGIAGNNHRKSCIKLVPIFGNDNKDRAIDFIEISPLSHRKNLIQGDLLYSLDFATKPIKHKAHFLSTNQYKLSDRYLDLHTLSSYGKHVSHYAYIFDTTINPFSYKNININITFSANRVSKQDVYLLNQNHITGHTLNQYKSYLGQQIVGTTLKYGDISKLNLYGDRGYNKAFVFGSLFGDHEYSRLGQIYPEIIISDRLQETTSYLAEAGIEVSNYRDTYIDYLIESDIIARESYIDEVLFTGIREGKEKSSLILQYFKAKKYRKADFLVTSYLEKESDNKLNLVTLHFGDKVEKETNAYSFIYSGREFDKEIVFIDDSVLAELSKEKVAIVLFSSFGDGKAVDRYGIVNKSHQGEGGEKSSIFSTLNTGEADGNYIVIEFLDIGQKAEIREVVMIGFTFGDDFTEDSVYFHSNFIGNRVSDENAEVEYFYIGDKENDFALVSSEVGLHDNDKQAFKNTGVYYKHESDKLILVDSFGFYGNLLDSYGVINTHLLKGSRVSNKKYYLDHLNFSSLYNTRKGRNEYLVEFYKPRKKLYKTWLSGVRRGSKDNTVSFYSMESAFRATDYSLRNIPVDQYKREYRSKLSTGKYLQGIKNVEKDSIYKNEASEGFIKRISGLNINNLEKYAERSVTSSISKDNYVVDTERYKIKPLIKKDQICFDYEKDAVIERNSLVDKIKESVIENVLVFDKNKDVSLDNVIDSQGLMYNYSDILKEGMDVEHWDVGYAIPEDYNPKDPFNPYYPWAEEQNSYSIIQESFWEKVAGEWEIDKGNARIKSSGNGLIVTDNLYNDFKFKFNTVVGYDPKCRTGFIFKYKDTANYYKFTVSSGMIPFELVQVINGRERRIAIPMAPFHLVGGTKHIIDISYIDNRLVIYVDGRLQYDVILEE